MKTWLSQHWMSFRLVLRRFARTPLPHLFTIIVIGIAISLPAGLYVLLDNVRDVSSRLSSEPQISIFLAPSAGTQEIQQIQDKLRQSPLVARFRYIPRDKALDELRQRSGLGDVLEGLETNPLPDAFVITARDSAPAPLEQLRAEAQRFPGVAHVQLDSAWARRLDALLRLGNQAVLILAVLLGFALVAITGNTSRLQILTQREEIEVSKLIGATDQFIRRPFLHHGALQGMAGGFAAWAIVSGGIALLNRNVGELAQLYGSDFTLAFLSASDSLSIVGFSAVLGWLGAYVAVGRSLAQMDRRR
jgi:cell division transport system permease protein